MFSHLSIFSLITVIVWLVPSPLVDGQHVRVQDQNTKKWIPGTVKSKRPEPRSYEIQTESGSTLRRNRRHLRPAGTQQVEMGSREETSSGSEEYPASVFPSALESTEASHTTVMPSPISDITATPATPTKIPMETRVEPYRTRSGRAVNRPTRFAE